MSKKARWLIAGITVLAVAIAAVLYLGFKVKAGIVASIGHKSVKTANATIVRIDSVLDGAGPSKDEDVTQQYRVCFVFDDFDQVEPDMRQGYRNAEARRLVENGPRCEVTNKLALAKSLKRGDKVKVVFLLENQYQIDIARVTFSGESL